MLERQERSSLHKAALLEVASEPSATHYTTTPASTGTYDPDVLQAILEEVCRGFEPAVSTERLLAAVRSTIYAGISDQELWQALIMAARSMIEIEPAYTFVTARILLISLYNEAFSTTATTRVGLSTGAEQYRYWPAR